MIKLVYLVAAAIYCAIGMTLAFMGRDAWVTFIGIGFTHIMVAGLVKG